MALQRGNQRVPEARGQGFPARRQPLTSAAKLHAPQCRATLEANGWELPVRAEEEDRGCLDGCYWKNRETSSALAVPVPLTYKYLAFLPYF